MTAKSEPTLESYSKAALIRYIRESMFFFQSDWAAKLERIELQIKLERNRARDAKLIEEQAALKLPQDFKRWKELSAEWERLQEEWESLMNQLYPRTGKAKKRCDANLQT